MLEPCALQGVWADEVATQQFADTLAASIVATPQGRNVFATLQGGLGAGKTSLVRHLLRALGVTGRVKSPTYAVVESYELQDSQDHDWAIWHFDFYRFSDPQEWTDAGFRELFASFGLKLAEWPQNAAPHLPLPDLQILIEVQADESRRYQIVAQTPLGKAVLAKMPGMAS